MSLSLLGSVAGATAETYSCLQEVAACEGHICISLLCLLHMNR